MKRLLLILAAIIGLVVAGSTLAGYSGVTHPERALQVLVAPRHRAPQHHAACPAPAKTLTLAAAPGRYLVLDPPAAALGAAVTVYGGGFAPGAALHLGLQVPGARGSGSNPLPRAHLVARRDGSFCTSITVPVTQAAPSTEVVAQDTHGRTATATLLLRAAQPLAGLAPSVVRPGQRGAVWAVNFRPGEMVRVYATRLAGRPLLTGVADAKGHGYWPLAVPYGVAGKNQLVVIGAAGRAPVVAPYLLLSLYPHASVSNYAPQPSQRVTFFGGGFGPREPVTLRLDRPEGPVLATARTNAGGGLPRLGPYRVPFGLAGVHTFILHGMDSHVTTTVDLRIEPFFANARPSTYAAGPGTTLTFYGSGFAPHEIVRVYLGRTGQSAGTEVAALRTTAAGQLVGGSGSYALPSALGGPTLTFTLVGDISGAVATTTVHYMVPSGSSVLVGPTAAYHPPARQHVTPIEPRVPVLVATPPRVVPGGRVALSGTDFPPHAAVRLVLVSNDNPRGWVLGTVSSGADGTLNKSVTIPPGVTYADVVRADAGGSATAQAELVVRSTMPHLKASAESGPAGTAYSLSGEGFMPGERVAVYLDSIAAPPLAVTSSGDGRIAFANLRVPVAAQGNHTFVVKGTQGDTAAVSFTEWAVTPYLLLSTYSSLPERPVSVSGQGFVPGEAIHLFLAGTLVDTAAADDRGALHASPAFKISSNARGPLPVVAVGTQSGRPARTTLDVLAFEPSLWLSSYAGHPGATVAFTGTGFARDDILHVYLGDAARPAATFRARNGAFVRAGTVRIPFGTRAGVLRLTVRGALSGASMTLRYRVVPFTPGAGFAVRHRRGVTVLLLGAGGFAPHETVQLYQGTHAGGTPLRLLHADAAGNVSLLRVFAARGTPKTRLAYTLVGVRTGARVTALYPPHTTRAGG